MTTKTSEARIYTGAEALRLLDGPVPGPYRSEWPLTREIVADFDGAVVPIASPASTSPGTERANVRLLAAAPDLAASVAHHEARTLDAMREAAEVATSRDYLARQVEHEGAALQRAWREGGGEGSAPNADAAVDALKARAERAESQRDANDRAFRSEADRVETLTEQVEALHSLTGCEREWTNLHDLGDCAVKCLDGVVTERDILRARADDAERVAVDLRDDLRTLRVPLHRLLWCVETWEGGIDTDAELRALVPKGSVAEPAPAAEGGDRG